MQPFESNNEVERLSELRSYAVLDTPPEEAFDDLTKLASYICGAPISIVSMVDSERIWFKSKLGLETSEIQRMEGFCSSAIQSDDLLIVPDAAADERLASHPLVTFNPRLRFYAGAPLISPRGQRLGTLCVIDVEPRTLTTEQTEALRSLARTAITHLEFRRTAQSHDEVHNSLRDLQARTEMLVQQRTEQLKLSNDSLRRLSGQLIRAQDDERRRIARDLHDSTGQLLAALSMTLSQMQMNSSTENLRKFDECKEMITSAATEIRNLSYLLHPPMMDEIGLVSAVREYVQGFEKRSGLSIHVEVATEIARMEPNREIVLFRIIQESLSNIHRHSGSPTATVKIAQVSNEIVLEIKDRGHGLLNASGQPVKSGVGISSMQERLRQYGGTLGLESNSTGTTVTATIPVEN